MVLMCRVVVDFPFLRRSPANGERQPLLQTSYQSANQRPEDLRIWRRETSKEDEETYSDGENPDFSIRAERARMFLEEFGPLHPGDYKAQFGTDWRDDFIKLGGTTSPT